MTRKDYVAIANAIRAEISLHPNESTDFAYRACEHVARNIAGVLAADNGRFDRARFLRACGIDA